ncbi:MAG: type II secretion system protein, partial [Proteobacteria bacterium]|nr:type II secretion system protein [Pseudomonadota bacterium]
MLPKIHLNKHKKHRAFSIVEIAIVLLIVSLLMAGILNGTSLISDASVATAQKLTTNSEVNTIESLSLWLESSFASSVE